MKARHQYVYLRVRYGIDLAGDAIAELGRHYGRPVEVLSPTANFQVWEDGLVFRVQSARPIDALQQDLKEGLRKFEAWAIHDARSSGLDDTGFGPVSTFFRDGDRRTAQIFLGFDDDAAAPQATISSIRDALGPEDCHRGFQFRNGEVLLLGKYEPAKVILRRIERLLTDDVVAWVICDANGDALNASGFDRRVWRRSWLQNLYYGIPA